MVGRSLVGERIQCTRMLTTGDDLQSIVWALSEASRTASLVICTGGLGPTVDDRTAEAVAAGLVDRQESSEALDQIAERYARMGRSVSDTNRKQAFLPVRAPKIVGVLHRVFQCLTRAPLSFVFRVYPWKCERFLSAHLTPFKPRPPIHLHRIRHLESLKVDCRRS